MLSEVIWKHSVGDHSIREQSILTEHTTQIWKIYVITLIGPRRQYNIVFDQENAARMIEQWSKIPPVLELYIHFNHTKHKEDDSTSTGQLNTEQNFLWVHQEP